MTLCGFRPTLRWLCLPVALLLVPAAAHAEPDYRLQRGDVLAINVAGFPELSQRATVQIGGWIADNLVGRIDAAGATVSELQNRLRELLNAHPYQKMNPDGQFVILRISPDALTVDVAVYRPVYVDGDVAKPGELAYRPGLLTRQAIALAGGYDILRGRMSETERLLDEAELRGEAERDLAAEVSTQAAIDRLRTLLRAPDSATQNGPRAVSGAAETPKLLVDQLQDSSAHQLNLAVSEAKGDSAFYKSAIQQADDELKILHERQAQESAGMAADLADYERVQALLRQGTVALTRVSDARRAWQFSAVQSLQTLSNIAEVERARAKAVRDLEALDTTRQIDFEKQLSVALVEHDAALSRLSAVRDKLHVLGVRHDPSDGAASRPVARLTIHRGAGADAVALVADENTELQPGDSLEIRIDTPDTATLTRR